MLAQRAAGWCEAVQTDTEGSPGAAGSRAFGLCKFGRQITVIRIVLCRERLCENAGFRMKESGRRGGNESGTAKLSLRLLAVGDEGLCYKRNVC